MGNLRAQLSIALLALAACGEDAAKPDALIIIDAAIDAPPIDAPPDAPNYDFTCLGNTAPTTAIDPVTLSGTVSEVVLNGGSPSVQNASGVTLEACTGNCNGPNSLGTTTSAADGTFTTPALVTGSMPLDGYVIATKTGSQTTYIYPAAPLTMDTAGAPVLMLTSQVYNLIGFVPNITHTAGRAIVGTFVTDCANTPIPDAVVTVSRNGTELGETQSAGSFSAQGAGAFITTDVVPDGTDPETVVGATYGGMTFRAHTVRTLANTITTTQIRPGY